MVADLEFQIRVGSVELRRRVGDSPGDWPLSRDACLESLSAPAAAAYEGGGIGMPGQARERKVDYKDVHHVQQHQPRNWGQRELLLP